MGHKLVEEQYQIGHLLAPPGLGSGRRKTRRVRVEKLEEMILKVSVVDRNTLNLDPDPGFWSSLDPDPGFNLERRKKLK